MKKFMFALALLFGFTVSAENLARYSTDGGANWTEAANIKEALKVVQGGSTAAIIEFKGDSALSGSGHKISCDVTIRPWPVAAGGTGGCYRFYSTNDYDSKLTLNSGATLTISNLNVESTLYRASFITVSSGATLRFEEGTTITTTLASNAGQAIATSGTVIFDGGVVRGWNVTQNGVVKYTANTGRVYIYNGGVENCTNASTGDTSAAAIAGEDYEFKDVTEPVFVMTGGFIRNNHCSNSSGRAGALGFRSGAAAIIAISGGAITNNTGVSPDFTAVRLGNTGTLRISGNPIIADNIADSSGSGVVKNIDLTLGTPGIVQYGNLTAGANVGVYSSNYTEDSVFGTLADSSYTGSGFISNDRDATLVGSADGTNLKWATGAPALTVTLTVPEKTGLNKPTVTCTSGSATETSAASGFYAWTVPQNVTATLTYTAVSGYSITSGNPVQTAIGTADVTLTSADLPTVEEVQVINPSIGSVAAAVDGTTATITLSDVVMGTGPDGSAATSYSISWQLAGQASTSGTVTDKSGATASFDLTGLAAGDYTCTVSITTDKGITSASVTTEQFTIVVPPPAAGWTVEPMTSTGDAFRTDGTLVAAYSIQGGEVNGITFVMTRPVTAQLSPNPAPVGNRYGDFGWAGMSTQCPFRDILSHASYWNSGSEVSLTFSGLTVGNNYLVQFMSHNDSAPGITISIEGTTPQHVCKVDSDATYQYGASIVGIFTAAAATKTVTVTFTGLSAGTGTAGEGTLNAIQIRDLGAAPKTKTGSVIVYW